MPQCLGAVYGTHIDIKQPSQQALDSLNRKNHYSLNVQATCDYRYCFSMLSSNAQGVCTMHAILPTAASAMHCVTTSYNVPSCSHKVLEDEEPMGVFLPGDPAYPFLPYRTSRNIRGAKFSRLNATFVLAK